MGYNDALRCERAANAADFVRSLIAAGKVSESAVDRARRVSAESGEHLELVLPRLGLISERELSEAFAGFLEMPLVSAKDFPAEPVLEDRLSAEFLRERHLIPYRE